MKLEKLAPAFQDYLWGGTRLRDVYGKNCGFDKVAESWELSTHPAGESCIAGGELDGLPLAQYFERFPQALGENAARFDRFPLLIKLIDAKEPLSIQVHPSDEYALKAEGEYGKTEMWVVVDSDPGAFLYFGVNRPVSREELRQRIQDNTLLEVLRRVEVHPGDVFFIPAGTLHAIGAGLLICEIQQNSNCTYRVYDYGRVGADGKPRPLHVEKALDVCRLEPSDTGSHLGPVRPCAGGQVQLVGHCPYFSTQRLQVEEALMVHAGAGSFVSLMATRGEGLLEGPENAIPFRAGESLLIPAGTGPVRVSGEGELIMTTVPPAGEL